MTINLRGAVCGLLGASLLGFAVLLAAAPARAQSEPKVFKDWALHCEQLPENAPFEGCYIVQNIINNESQKLTMQFAVGLLKADRKPVAMITLPLGIRLPPGVAMQIDQNQPARIPVEICLPVGCRVQFLMSPEHIAAFKAGANGQLIYQDAIGRSRPLPFSLSGFTAAFAALGS